MMRCCICCADQRNPPVAVGGCNIALRQATVHATGNPSVSPTFGSSTQSGSLIVAFISGAREDDKAGSWTNTGGFTTATTQISGTPAVRTALEYLENAPANTNFGTWTHNSGVGHL